MRSLSLRRARLVRDNDGTVIEGPDTTDRVGRTGDEPDVLLDVGAFERPVDGVPDELDDDAVAVEEDGTVAHRPPVTSTDSHFPGAVHERGMGDEEMPHDRLELLDVRRAALGRRVDDDADVGFLRGGAVGSTDDSEDACAHLAARARSRERGSPRRCARGFLLPRRTRGSRPARRGARSAATRRSSSPIPRRSFAP